MTLIGYSVGARVIFSCALELHKRYQELVKQEAASAHDTSTTATSTASSSTHPSTNDTSPPPLRSSDLLGLIDTMVIIGGPLPITPARWAKVRMMVTHRVINCFHLNDWVLWFLYRYKTYAVGVAGVVKVCTDSLDGWMC